MYVHFLLPLYVQSLSLLLSSDSTSLDFFAMFGVLKINVNERTSKNTTHGTSALTDGGRGKLNPVSSLEWPPSLFSFYCAMLCIERVFATVTCLSVRPSFTAGTVSKQKDFMISSPSDSPMISLSGKVWLVEKSARVHREHEWFLRLGWVQTGDFCDFSTYKPPYRQKGARYDQGIER